MRRARIGILGGIVGVVRGVPRTFLAKPLDDDTVRTLSVAVAVAQFIEVDFAEDPALFDRVASDVLARLVEFTIPRNGDVYVN